MLDIKDFIVGGMQENIVNEDVYKGRDILELAIELFKKTSKIMLLGHRTYVASPLDVFMMDMEDVLHKTTDVKNPYNSECQVIRSKIHMDLNKTKMDILHLYFVINPNVLSGERREKAIDATRSRLNDKVNEIIYGAGTVDYDSPAWRMLKTPPSGTYYGEKDQDLFHEVKLYIPRLINKSYFLINNNRYYNGYYIKNKLSLTAKGELTISFDDEKFALLYRNFKDKTLKVKIFKKDFNPFLFIFRDRDPVKIKDLFPDHFNQEKAMEEVTEYGKLIKKTYLEYEKMKNKNIDIDLDGDTIVRHINLFGENEVLETKAGLDGEADINDTEDLPFEFKLNSTIYKETNNILNKKILARAMKVEQIIVKDINGDNKHTCAFDEDFGYAQMKKPNKDVGQDSKLAELKRIIKFPPKMFLTTITTKPQFSKRSSANEVDIFELFRYITLMEGKFIAMDKRKFQQEQLGIIDPIGTSQSDSSVGISGQICYGVESKYLK